MRTIQFSSKSLVALFHRQRIATMQDLKKALGTKVDRTVFRKLREVSYFTSYSHRGKFYALDALAEFDDRVISVNYFCRLTTTIFAGCHSQFDGPLLRPRSDPGCWW